MKKAPATVLWGAYGCAGSGLSTSGGLFFFVLFYGVWGDKDR